MMKLPSRLCVVLAACLLSAQIDIAQEKGSIQGTVVDEHGLPASNVRENADRANGQKRASLIRYPLAHMRLLIHTVKSNPLAALP
jgi:hypothetical protein